MNQQNSEPCRILEWDSDFFQTRIARVQATRLTAELSAQIDAWCAEHNVKCLYFLADADDNETVLIAERNGYHLADIRMTFTLEPISTGKISTDLAIRVAKRQDVKALTAIARGSFTDGRFYYDDHFSRAQCDHFYET